MYDTNPLGLQLVRFPQMDFHRGPKQISSPPTLPHISRSGKCTLVDTIGAWTPRDERQTAGAKDWEYRWIPGRRRGRATSSPSLYLRYADLGNLDMMLSIEAKRYLAANGFHQICFESCYEYLL